MGVVEKEYSYTVEVKEPCGFVLEVSEALVMVAYIENHLVWLDHKHTYIFYLLIFLCVASWYTLYLRFW